MAVKGNYAFIGNGAMLQVLDISNPSDPKPAGQLLTDGEVTKVIVSGNYAYTLRPFRIIDISNPLYPRLVTTYQLPVFPTYPPTALTVQGNYAYLGDFNGDIFIIDISDPSNPKTLGKMLASGEMTNTIVVENEILYVITADGLSIDVFDISNPASPKLLTQSIFGTEGTSLAISGHYLYLGATGSPQLRIYDVTDPSNPRYINGINLNSFPLSISIEDTVALLPSNGSDFTIVDVADTSNIHVIASLKNPFGFPNSYGIGEGAIAEDIIPPYAFLPTGTGLWIVNIDQVNSPKSISFFSAGWGVYNLRIDSSHHAFVETAFAGLKVVDGD